MGDFNTCLLKNDWRSTTLNSISVSNNLHILPLNATHHFPNSTPSLLDLIFVSSLDHVAKHGQCPADEFSYHDLIFLSYKFRPQKAKPKILLQRNFGGMNTARLIGDAKAIDWGSLFAAKTVNDKISIFENNLTNLYDFHAPIRAIKLRHLPSPWLTDEIKVLLRKKAAAKSKYKAKPNEHNKIKYVTIRNHCNKVCRNAQRQHIHNSVQNENPVKVWKFLKSLGVGKQRLNISPNNLDINMLNHHFCASSNIDKTTKMDTLCYLSSLPTPDYDPFVFSQFTACDVKKSVLSITSNAIGSDGITRNMILHILDEILPIITHILNYSLSSCVFPTSWKLAHVVPLPKKPNPLTLSDYRPISILSFLSKILERLIYNQLNTFLTVNNLLNPYQSGFRPGHSTTTTLVNITDDIRMGMEDGKLTVLCLLDFSNAFNTVDFDILLAILRSLNISPSVIDWFHSYLYGRRQCVRLDDTYSSWCDNSAGVPQGGVLSPLLFSIFINSISNNISSSYHLYADDMQIYVQANLENLTHGIATINNDLERISEWTRKYGLKVNPTKTQVVVVGSNRLTSKVNYSLLPRVIFEGLPIPVSDSVKNLGIHIDNALTWSVQLQHVSKKLFAAAASLRRLRNFLPITTKVALVHSTLLSILDYADVSYLDLNEDQLDKLERLQNFCIRFIFGLRKYDHVSEFRTKLKWLPIRFRRNTHILCLVYNILFNSSSPSYLKKRFTFLHDTHLRNLRSSENLRLKIPAHSTRFYEKSFTVQGVRLWNALQEAIRRSKSLSIFKHSLLKHYLTFSAVPS